MKVQEDEREREGERKREQESEGERRKRERQRGRTREEKERASEREKERKKFPYRLTVGVVRVFNRLSGVHSEIPSVNYADFQCIQTPWNFYDCLTAALPYATGGEICTTEIFQGFNFINDHPVPAAREWPDDPCSIDLSPLRLFRYSGLLVLPCARDTSEGHSGRALDVIVLRGDTLLHAASE